MANVRVPPVRSKLSSIDVTSSVKSKATSQRQTFTNDEQLVVRHALDLKMTVRLAPLCPASHR